MRMHYVRFGGAIAVSAAMLLAAPDKPQFETEVSPILAAHCTKCHNPAKAPVGLDLSALPGVVKGSKNGPVVVPGSPDSSILYQRISKHSMPPKGQRPLEESDIELIKKWIES